MGWELSSGWLLVEQRYGFLTQEGSCCLFSVISIHKYMSMFFFGN